MTSWDKGSLITAYEDPEELDPDEQGYEDILIEMGRDEYRDTWFEYIKDYCDFF